MTTDTRETQTVGQRTVKRWVDRYVNKVPNAGTYAELSNAIDKWPAGVCAACRDVGLSVGPHVHTIHKGQIVELEDGDWIVPEPDGVHYYPIRDDVLRGTYEPVED